MTQQKGDVKESTVKKITEDLVRSSNGGISHEKAREMARESADRVNRERREKR